MRRSRWQLAAALLLGAGVGPAVAGEWSYHGSLGLSTGRYTLSDRSTLALLSNGLTWSGDRWRVSAAVPFVYQDTPFLTSAGVTPLPTDPEVELDELGVGDPLVRIDFQGGAATGRWGLFVGAKAPLGDESSGFSTGEWDTGGGVTFGGAAGGGRVFGEVGFWRFGDPPGLEIEDAATATLGYFRPLADGSWAWMVLIGGFSEGIAGADAPVDVGVTLLRQPVGRVSWSIGLGAGLTESAPDARLVVGWSVDL